MNCLAGKLFVVDPCVGSYKGFVGSNPLSQQVLFQTSVVVCVCACACACIKHVARFDPLVAMTRSIRWSLQFA